MLKAFKRISLVLLILLIWTLFVAAGLMKGFLLRPLTAEKSPEAFIAAVKEKIGDEFVGNLAMVLIEDGEIAEDFYHSIDKPITANTVFPVASISKWITSFGVLKLVEQGKLELDKSIDDYLTRWNLPESKFDNRKVTIRRLLSHSSGLVDELGYHGFALHEESQTIEESLIQASDAPYSEGVAIVGYEPGSKYMYSGAGYTILQLIIEEVSGMAFQEFIKKEVFLPLNMNNSAFAISGENESKLVSIYKNDGEIRAYRKFTALAAASLLTTASDLSKFLLANVLENEVLKSQTIAMMSKPQSFINKTPIYGLGPHLYSQNDKKSNIIGHDGSGNNALNTAARIDLKSKDGIILFETGSFDFASSMADEWMFCKARIADYVVITRNKSYLITLLLIGYIIIILSSIFLINRRSI